MNWDVHSSHFFVLSVLVNAEKLLLSSNKTNNAASNNLIKFFKAVAKLSKYMPGIQIALFLRTSFSFSLLTVDNSVQKLPLLIDLRHT